MKPKTKPIFVRFFVAGWYDQLISDPEERAQAADELFEELDDVTKLRVECPDTSKPGLRDIFDRSESVFIIHCPIHWRDPVAEAKRMVEEGADEVGLRLLSVEATDRPETFKRAS